MKDGHRRETVKFRFLLPVLFVMEIRDLSDNLCAMLSEAAPGVMELLIQKVQREWFYLFFPRCPISNSVKESACLESEMF